MITTDGLPERRMAEEEWAKLETALRQLIGRLGAPASAEVEAEAVELPSSGGLVTECRPGATRLVIRWPDPTPDAASEARVSLTAKGAALAEFLKAGGSETAFCAGWDAACAAIVERPFKVPEIGSAWQVRQECREKTRNGVRRYSMFGPWYVHAVGDVVIGLNCSPGCRGIEVVEWAEWGDWEPAS